MEKKTFQKEGGGFQGMDLPGLKTEKQEEKARPLEVSEESERYTVWLKKSTIAHMKTFAKAKGFKIKGLVDRAILEFIEREA